MRKFVQESVVGDFNQLLICLTLFGVFVISQVINTKVRGNDDSERKCNMILHQLTNDFERLSVMSQEMY